MPKAATASTITLTMTVAKIARRNVAALVESLRGSFDVGERNGNRAG
jgi:hypothetical protein